MLLDDSNGETINHEIINAALQEENFCFVEYDVKKVCMPFFSNLIPSYEVI